MPRSGAPFIFFRGNSFGSGLRQNSTGTSFLGLMLSGRWINYIYTVAPEFHFY